MRNLIYVLCALLTLVLMACSGGKTIIEGSTTGGGGFAGENSEKILKMALDELILQLGVLDEGMITGLPRGWTTTKMIKILKNNLVSQPKLYKDRDGVELMLDYSYDGENSKIYLLAQFFNTYNVVPVDYEKPIEYGKNIKDIKKLLLHELGHIIYRHDLAKAKGLSNKQADDQARSFAHLMILAMDDQNLVCETGDIQPFLIANTTQDVSANILSISEFPDIRRGFYEMGYSPNVTAGVSSSKGGHPEFKAIEVYDYMIEMPDAAIKRNKIRRKHSETLSTQLSNDWADDEYNYFLEQQAVKFIKSKFLQNMINIDREKIISLGDLPYISVGAADHDKYFLKSLDTYIKSLKLPRGDIRNQVSIEQVVNEVFLRIVTSMLRVESRLHFVINLQKGFFVTESSDIINENYVGENLVSNDFLNETVDGYYLHLNRQSDMLTNLSNGVSLMREGISNKQIWATTSRAIEDVIYDNLEVEGFDPTRYRHDLQLVSSEKNRLIYNAKIPGVSSDDGLARWELGHTRSFSQIDVNFSKFFKQSDHQVIINRNNGVYTAIMNWKKLIDMNCDHIESGTCFFQRDAIMAEVFNAKVKFQCQPYFNKVDLSEVANIN